MLSFRSGAIMATIAAMLLVCVCASPSAMATEGTQEASDVFRVGYAEQDITPPVGLPMWGYGARHALAATGAITPLFARVVVIHAGGDKLAIMGLDLGRGPTAAMMEQIRAAIGEQADIAHVLISGSHTHHGPVIELTDREGFGKGTFDKAVKYSQALPGLLVDAILAADRAARPARMGVSSRSDLDLNRNRHTKRSPPARDPMLAVMRFDDEHGEPIAVVTNFAGHPVMTDPKILQYSADYPGFLADKVKAELGCGCVFMQGASGDMSVNPPGEYRDPEAFGHVLAQHVAELAGQTETKSPEAPSVAGRIDRFQFRSRIDFNDPLVRLQYSAAFFPELISNAARKFADGIPAELNTIVLNGTVALVGGSGEFFCNHANRLKERVYLEHTLFFGYCNGHSLYFPTIEAVSEGGYGADAPVSPVEIGAGERMMNRALLNTYVLSGKITPTADSEPAARE